MPAMQRQDFRFFHRLRVRWAEVDMQKIVFNGHYLMYLDTAAGDYWRALALPYQATMAAFAGDLYVKKAQLEYHASARYDDQLDIGMRCARIGTASMVFAAGVFRGDTLLVGGELVYVFADPASQTSRPVPDALRAALLGFEAGDAVTLLQTGDWATLRAAAAPLRQAVFVEEQGVPADMEWDSDDHTALHAVSRNRLGDVVATARLLPAQNGVARIGRMAVSPLLRGSGFGAEVLHALLQVARQRGDRQVLLHAQRSAEAFYARAGFVAHGEPFMEAGIPHIEMLRNL